MCVWHGMCVGLRYENIISALINRALIGKVLCEMFVNDELVSGTAKQSQLMHNMNVYLYNLCLLVHLPNTFR
jgi:hypothetical protein